MFTIHQGLIVQMERRDEGGGGGARRPARDHELKRRPGDGMMSWSAPHQALSSHIKQPINSPAPWATQGAMSDVTLL